MKRGSILASLALVAIALAACGQTQSFDTPAEVPSRSGEGWRAIGPEGIDVSSLAVSPDYASDSTIFIGLHGWDLGVFRSTDGGDSWKKVSRGVPRYQDEGECCGYYAVHALVFSPAFAHDDTLFLGTWNGLFRSTDRGDTWHEVGRGLDDTRVIQASVSPGYGEDGTVFVVASNKDWDAGPSLYRSTDRGDTWHRVAQRLDVSWGRWIAARLVLSPSFDADGTLFAATLGGLLRSTDRGATWQAIYSYDDVLEGNFEPWVAISPDFARDGTLFTSKVCGGVARSTDRGNTWEQVDKGLTVPGMALSSAYRVCDPPGFASLVFPPSSTGDSGLFVWTEVGIFQLSESFLKP